MNFIKTTLILAGIVVAGVAGAIHFGVIHPGADEPHSALVHKVIQTARDRAIAVRADDLTVPALGDAEQVKAGAGNYAAMCTGCHLAPGMAPTELSRGLYPPAPALAELGAPDPARAFWVTKHGIKASGMPAWGKSMGDPYLWDMVAFLQKLPELSPEQYRALVASSGGHSHGGGESLPHDDAGTAPHDHAPAEPAPASHVHADGKTHVHHDNVAPEKAATAGHGDHDGH